MTNDELLHKWVNKSISQDELEVFKQRPEYDSLLELYRNTEGLQTPQLDGESMLQDILNAKKPQVREINLNTINKKQGFLQKWMKYGIAASILIGAFYLLLPIDNGKVEIIAEQNQVEGVLPDASSFTLNAGSNLSYNSENWQDERILQLNGEAFFKVTKGEKFEVITKSGIIQVIGTEFNVRSQLGMLEVVCREGSVRVVSKDESVLEVLTATQGVKIRSSGEVIRWYDETGSSTGWLKGITQLKDVTLQEVIYSLENQFGVKINVTDLNMEERVSCSFQHEELDLAIKTATAPLKVRWEIKNKSVRLFK